jgi:sulfatase modifying factor 1
MTLRRSAAVALAVAGCGGRMQPDGSDSDGGFAEAASPMDAQTLQSADGGTPPNSDTVPGGTFLRDYDGVYATDNSHPATVSTFALDRYEVTVGRFRQFVGAVVAGWRPSSGSGKHTHLNDGRGLIDTGSGTYEKGWDSAWTGDVPTTLDAWTGYLECMWHPTWTSSVGANENLPIGCADWYQAYAFCIWNGGFLPTEAEWNYAASGGSEQRLFPWSEPPTSQTVNCTFANYLSPSTCDSSPDPVGAHSPKGDGRWGQADLGGNVREWTLDWQEPYQGPCNDCANLTGSNNGGRAVRGGAYDTVNVTAAYPDIGDPSDHMYGDDIGFRCGRAP